MEIVEKVIVVRSAKSVKDSPLICARCYYWSGNPGNRPTDLVCAVAVPRPSLAELERVNGRVAYAQHNCKDFEREVDG